MKRTTLKLLVCPICQNRLELVATAGEELIEEGSLRCLKCLRRVSNQRGNRSFY